MPVVTLNIVIWTVNTGMGAPYSGNIAGSVPMAGSFEYRLAKLKDALGVARGWFGGQPHPEPALDIFIAPEDLFSADEGEADLKCRLMLEAVAPGLSKGLLLIPGTIHWRKPVDAELDDRGEHGGAKQEKRDALRQRNAYQPNRGEKVSGPLLERYTDLHTGYYKRVGHLAAQIDPMGAAPIPDEQLSQFTVPTMYQGRMNKELESFAASGKRLKEAYEGKKPAYVVRNTAYAFHDGFRVLKYHKRWASTTTPETSKRNGELHEFIPGHRSGNFPVTIQGSGYTVTLKCGLEVCADHGPETLAHSEGGRALDLHFIVSNMVSNRSGSLAARSGGFVVHASSECIGSADAHSGPSGVYTHDGKPALQAKMEKIDPGYLLFYTCELKTT